MKDIEVSRPRPGTLKINSSREAKGTLIVAYLATIVMVLAFGLPIYISEAGREPAACLSLCILQLFPVMVFGLLLYPWVYVDQIHTLM